MKQLLSLPQPPTAVFAVSDRAATGALEAIKEAGLSVPGDISLAGFDDLYAGHTVPPLTTVRYAVDQMAIMAMDRLLARIQGLAEEPVRIAVYPELIQRASTAPPAECT
jgi:DNA-binding LacI/PurR family transcriptional regulator